MAKFNDLHIPGHAVRYSRREGSIVIHLNGHFRRIELPGLDWSEEHLVAVAEAVIKARESALRDIRLVGY